MKAFLINPKDETITEVETDASLDDIYRLVGARLVDVVRMNADNDVIYVDEEGLFKSDQSFFSIATYPSPLAGNGLVLGTTSDGENDEPLSENIYSLPRTVKWLTFEEAIAMATQADKLARERMAEMEKRTGMVGFHLSTVEAMGGREES